MSQGPHRESLLLPIVIPLGALAVIGAVLFGFSRILLGVSHNAATVVACVVAVTIMVAGGLVGLVVLVGPSRIYQGHHWPTDVTASYFLGTTYLIVVVSAYRRVKGAQALAGSGTHRR